MSEELPERIEIQAGEGIYCTLLDAAFRALTNSTQALFATEIVDGTLRTTLYGCDFIALKHGSIAYVAITDMLGKVLVKKAPIGLTPDDKKSRRAIV